MSQTITELKTTMAGLKHNPAGIQRLSLELLEEISNGEIDIVDPSNPFIFLLEAAATQASVAMTHSETLTREQYPSLAITEEELYLHMSDRDYVGRFSTPSRTTFTVLLEKEELKRKAVETDLPGTNKMVIPKHTEFSIAGMRFTMQYPIEIRVLEYGGIRIVYNNDQISPLETLSTNVVDWDIVKLEGNEFVRIQIPVNQFGIETHYGQLSKSTPYNETFAFEDNFYYVRAYYSDNGKDWNETRVTHTEQVFDPLQPTVVLQTFEGKVSIKVPQVYIDSGVMSGTVRFDVYTTKGNIDVSLDGYEINSFLANWYDRDTESFIDKYVFPLTNFSSMAVYSDQKVNGGTNGIEFEELRERVMTNALGNSQLPITENQLKARLSNKGYTGTRIIDNVTDRTYLATRFLPNNTNVNTISSAASGTQLIQVKYSDLIDQKGSVVFDERAVITPERLFNIESGIIRPITDSRLEALNELSQEELMLELNSGNYLSSPFFTILDNTKDYFETRAYYLDSPELISREFVEENTGLGFYIASDNFSMERTENGYVLQITTVSGDLVKELSDDEILPVISFTPNNSRSEVYIEGQLVGMTSGNERVYNFFFESDFDINSDNELHLKNFNNYQNDPLVYTCDLTSNFELVFYIKNVSGTYGNLTYRPNCYLIDSNDYGATHERLSISFGTYLEGLWERSRSVVGEANYKRHEFDVYSYHEKDVYERDSDTGAIKLRRDGNGALVYNKLHNQGEPVIDEQGNHVIRYNAGDIVLDNEGNPIIQDQSDIIREFDIFLVDGRYRFVTDEADLEYIKEIPRTIVAWLQSDIRDFKNLMLEQTELMFRPISTIGKRTFLIDNKESRSYDLEQSFTVTYHMRPESINNVFLRDELKRFAIETINDELDNTTIRINDITSKLTEMVNDDVIAIKVEGLGGEDNLTTLSLDDKTSRCSIKKKIEPTLDGTIRIVDDVTVLYVTNLT